MFSALGCLNLARYDAANTPAAAGLNDVETVIEFAALQAVNVAACFGQRIKAADFLRNNRAREGAADRLFSLGLSVWHDMLSF